MALKQIQRKDLQQKDTQFILRGRVVQDSKLIPLRRRIERQGINMQELGTTPDTLIYFTPPSAINVFPYPDVPLPTVEANSMSILQPASTEFSDIFSSDIASVREHGNFDYQDEQIFDMEMEHDDQLGSYLPLPVEFDGIGAQFNMFMGSPDTLHQDPMFGFQNDAYTI